MQSKVITKKSFFKEVNKKHKGFPKKKLFKIFGLFLTSQSYNDLEWECRFEGLIYDLNHNRLESNLIQIEFRCTKTKKTVIDYIPIKNVLLIINK